MEVTTFRRYNEEFYFFALIGFLIILVERILSLTIFKRIP